MSGKSVKKLTAITLSLLIASGGMPIQPVADMFGSTSITASADSVLSGEGTQEKQYIMNC